MPYSIFQTKKDFLKIPTELNSIFMYINKELVKSDNIFFAGLKGLLGKEGIFEPDPKEGRSFFTGFYRINRK